MSKPKTMMIDEVKYVRADSVAASPDVNEEGLPYVVVRSRDQGVMVGFLKEEHATHVVLLRARQIWSWKSRFVLAEFAEFGPVGNGKVSCELSLPFSLYGQCGIYRCTATAGEMIRKVPPHVAG